MSGKTIIIYETLKIKSNIEAGYTPQLVIRETDISKTLHHDSP